MPSTVKYSVFALALLLSGCDQSTPAPEPANASTISFERISFQPETASQSIATFQDHLLTLGEPDDSANPTAWQGPLRIDGCQADVSLITAVYGASNAGYLVVATYSGSTRSLYFIDLATCKDLWPPVESSAGGITVGGDLATLPAECECPGGPLCTCTAALVFRLSAQAAPVELEEESLDATRSAIGVEFTGTRQVENPKTENARLVTP